MYKYVSSFFLRPANTKSAIDIANKSNVPDTIYYRLALQKKTDKGIKEEKYSKEGRLFTFKKIINNPTTPTTSKLVGFIGFLVLPKGFDIYNPINAENAENAEDAEEYIDEYTEDTEDTEDIEDTEDTEGGVRESFENKLTNVLFEDILNNVYFYEDKNFKNMFDLSKYKNKIADSKQLNLDKFDNKSSHLKSVHFDELKNFMKPVLLIRIRKLTPSETEELISEIEGLDNKYIHLIEFVTRLLESSNNFTILKELAQRFNFRRTGYKLHISKLEEKKRRGIKIDDYDYDKTQEDIKMLTDFIDVLKKYIPDYKE